MGIGPGSIANRRPPREDDQVRKARDLARTTRENAVAPTLRATQIGAGGLLVNEGGSITIQAPGTLNLGGGVLSVAASFTAGTTISAGTDVDAGANVNVGGLIKSVATYSNPITSSFRAVWVTSVDGQFGFNLSSREFKQDIADFAPDPATILALRLVTFRYIAAVESEGDEAQVQIGLIAEEVHDLGLDWLVEYDNGKPCGIKFHLIALALLEVTQNHEKRIADLEAKA